MRRHILIILTCLTVLTACQARPGSSIVQQSVANQPTPILNLNDAEQVAADFLKAWELDHYDVMYGLLTTESRDAISRTDFEETYTDAESYITLLETGKAATLTNMIQQGNTVQVAYDMTFTTRLVGTFNDNARTLRLVSTPEGWRVAWSPADVFAEFSDGGFLELTETQPNRANIYDRDGQVIADQNGVVYETTLLTKEYPTGNPFDCFNMLAQHFKARSAERMNEIYGGRTGQDYAYIVGELSQEDFDLYSKSLDAMCTLQYKRRPTRRYVAGGLAPHIVGYVGRIPAESADQWQALGYPPDALVGLDGIERYWEETLAGKGPAKLVIHTRNSTRVLAERAAVPSQSVYLTLDRKLQESLQESFREAYANAPWRITSTGAAAVVMDVRTGEILAIASYPDFNVDAFNPYTSMKDAQELINTWAKDPKKPTFSRATLGMYPPGSVFKIVSMAAAADSGQFKLTTPLYCSGTWDGKPLGDLLRRDWIYFTDQGRHGTINLKQALTGSCDTYFWNVGWKLNNVDSKILMNYAHKLGFGALTGIKDISEAEGFIPDPETYVNINGLKWSGSDALNAVIGQGSVQVTPLQITRMVAAIANGGTLYEPLLVQKAGIIGEPSYVAEPKPNGTIGVKPEVLEGIREAMCEVTTNPTIGTAQFIFEDFKGAVVCGKTGTAQVGGEFTQPHAWFAAFAGKTSDQPEIAIAVVVEHSHEGSFVAAPIVRNIVEAYYDLQRSPSWFQGAFPSLGSSD